MGVSFVQGGMIAGSVSMSGNGRPYRGLRSNNYLFYRVIFYFAV